MTTGMKSQHTLRAETFRPIIASIERHLGGHRIGVNKTPEKYWGPVPDVVRDLKGIINNGRRNEGRPAIEDDALRALVSLSFSTRVDDPQLQELYLALSNLREARLGVDKFRSYPPKVEGRQTG